MPDPHDRAPVPQAVGQRRHLTILFSDLSESTRLSDAMEAEHYAAMLAEVRGLYQNLIAKHGGTVVRIQGDGVLAIFGHPQAGEDDGRRATEAALELHHAVRRMKPQTAAAAWPAGQGLSLHTGIHAGMVLIEEGDAMRGRFELLGNTPNVAARLADEACADEILVSAETLGPLHPFFQTSERRLVPLKGRATPLAVYSILGQVSIGRRFEASKRRGLAPFVGRAAELALMELRLDQACSGQPQWLSLRASAGVGKTRLTEEFLRRAADRDCRVLRGYCESYLSAEPLQPYLQMLRTLQRQGSAEADAVLRGPAKERQEAVLQLLLQLAGQGPLLLLIDDLQWADDASLALLHRLRAEAERRALPLMLLSATRPAVVTETPALLLPIHHGHEAAEALHHHELLPLTEEEARQAIAQLLPGTDPFISAEVQRHAGGNPLFIEELCHALAHQRGSVSLRAAEEAPPALNPASGGHAWLAALIESRVARLPPAQAQLLRVAAVIGAVIPTWLFERISGCCEKDPVVLELAELDFIFPAEQPGLLRFKHGITRDVIYDSTGLHERQALHRHITAELRAQLVLGGQEPAHELLAYHGGAAGQWQDAAHHAEQAGDQALASSALDRAKKQYRAALAALEHLPPSEEVHQRWIAIAHRFGMACVFDASRADLRVLQHATGLAALSGDPTAMARSQYWLGYVRYALGEARAGLQICLRSLDQAQRLQDQTLLAQMTGTLGQIRAATAEYAPALQLLDQAIAQLRPRPSSGNGRPATRRPPIGLAYSLACRAYVMGDQGHFSAAEAAFDEALGLVQGSNHAVEASIQGWRAAVLLWQGRWAEAQVCAAETHRVGAQVRSLFTFAMGHAAGAYGAWMGGGCPLARQALEEAVAWLSPRGGGLFSSLNHGWLADILVQQGEADLARKHMAQALRRGQQSDWIGVAMAYRAAARLAQSQGQPERVTHYLAAAQAVAQRRGSMHERAVTELCTAELALQRGESAASRGLLDEAESAFFTMGMDWHLAKARELRKQL